MCFGYAPVEAPMNARVLGDEGARHFAEALRQGVKAECGLNQANLDALLKAADKLNLEGLRGVLNSEHKVNVDQGVLRMSEQLQETLLKVVDKVDMQKLQGLLNSKHRMEADDNIRDMVTHAADALKALNKIKVSASVTTEHWADIGANLVRVSVEWLDTARFGMVLACLFGVFLTSMHYGGPLLISLDTANCSQGGTGASLLHMGGVVLFLAWGVCSAELLGLACTWGKKALNNQGVLYTGLVVGVGAVAFLANLKLLTALGVTRVDAVLLVMGLWLCCSALAVNAAGLNRVVTDLQHRALESKAAHASLLAIEDHKAALTSENAELKDANRSLLSEVEDLKAKLLQQQAQQQAHWMKSGWSANPKTCEYTSFDQSMDGGRGGLRTCGGVLTKLPGADKKQCVTCGKSPVGGEGR